MNRRASCVGTFEVFEAAHVALRTLLAFSQPVNCIFWPIGMLNWLVAASKLHKHRETCCTAEWPFYSFLILWRRYGRRETFTPFPPHYLSSQKRYRLNASCRFYRFDTSLPLNCIKTIYWFHQVISSL